MYSPGTNNCTSQDSCLQKTEVTLKNLSKKINLLKKNWWLIELTGKQELFVPEGIKEDKI